MIGDRMDTDVVAGLEAGHADHPGAHRDHRRPATVERFPYRPSRVVDSIAVLADELGAV